jgi:hypothetical protein
MLFVTSVMLSPHVTGLPGKQVYNVCPKVLFWSCHKYNGSNLYKIASLQWDSLDTWLSLMLLHGEEAMKTITDIASANRRKGLTGILLIMAELFLKRLCDHSLISEHEKYACATCMRSHDE